MRKDHTLLYFLIIAVGAGIAWLIFFHEGGKEKVIHTQTHSHSDTVREIHTVEIRPEYREIPVEVKIQAKPDTALRHKVEQGTIITGGEIGKGKGSIQTIDTAGVKKESEFNTSEGDKVIFDANGNVQIKKKTKVGKALVKVWKGIKTGVEVAAAIFLVYELAK